MIHLCDKGNRSKIYCILNDKKVIPEFIGNRLTEGYIGIQNHDAYPHVSFRNIMIKEIVWHIAIFAALYCNKIQEARRQLYFSINSWLIKHLIQKTNMQNMEQVQVPSLTAKSIGVGRATYC
jgi:hypothetical protein